MAQQRNAIREMNFQQQSLPQRQGQTAPSAAAVRRSSIESLQPTTTRPNVDLTCAGPRPPSVYIDERGDLRRIGEPRPLGQLGKNRSFFLTAPIPQEAEATARLHGLGQERDGIGAGPRLHKRLEPACVWLPYLRDLARCPPVSFGDLSNIVQTQYPFQKENLLEEWWPQDFDSLFDLEAASAEPFQDNGVSEMAEGRDLDGNMLEQSPDRVTRSDQDAQQVSR